MELNCHCLQMTWYYTKDTTRKLLKHISEFGDAAWYRVNIQKSLAFLYTNNGRSEKEIQETIPFNCCNKKTKRIKCQGINLSKESKDLYSKNYKIWCKKSKMTQRERYTMFLDWKNQYRQNDYTTQGSLQIQCNLYHITNGISPQN